MIWNNKITNMENKAQQNSISTQSQSYTIILTINKRISRIESSPLANSPLSNK